MSPKKFLPILFIQSWGNWSKSVLQTDRHSYKIFDTITVLDPFPVSQRLVIPNYTLTRTNVVTNLHCFLTTNKSLWRLYVLAGISDWKNPDLYSGTFALFELPASLWGNLIKNESKLLEKLKVLTKLCLYIWVCEFVQFEFNMLLDLRIGRHFFQNNVTTSYVVGCCCSFYDGCG